MCCVCRRFQILKTLGRADFLTQIPEKWSQFWGVVAIHFRDVVRPRFTPSQHARPPMDLHLFSHAEGTVRTCYSTNCGLLFSLYGPGFYSLVGIQV